MLYEKNKSRNLSPSLFKDPTSEYRGAPFWAWNCKLKKEMLLEQIEIFKEMGFGGFHMHARIGLDTTYLGDEFMECVKACSKKAVEENMLCWLYDEDCFPSGPAGGIVNKDIRFKARHMLFSKKIYPEMDMTRDEFNRLVEKGENPAGYRIASYHVELENSFLKNYQRVDCRDSSKGPNLWHVYLKIADRYIDTMNPQAVKRFIEVTYERYYDAVGSEFGKSIPAIFTDEPHISRERGLPWFMTFAESDEDATFPFTDDFPETYFEEYGEDLLEHLPEVLWQLPGNAVSATRYRFHNHLAERFARGYADTLGEWCERHNIYLTGHLLSEPTLFTQTLRLGEAMRQFRSFQLPGIDILCDDKEFSTAKQAASITQQYGREGVLSELYGVTHWYHDFKGHKLQGDWQAALGVTVRVPHLSFLSMEGEAKRDWPASINYQSPWYKEYKFIEDHFARLNTALTRGKREVGVAVIHPIESFWLLWGPSDQTSLEREQYDQNFTDCISWLLFGLIDFDFISEALLPDLCPENCTNPLKVGEMEYTTVLVPDCITLRETTVKRLEAFKKAGGQVIFAGDVPGYVDAVPSDRVKTLAKSCKVIQFSKAAILKALENERRIEARLPDGRMSDNLFYQLRQDNEGKWLFICHVNRKNSRFDSPEHYRFRIKGRYNPAVYDTLTGETRPCPAEISGNDTIIQHTMYGEDSILLWLEKGEPAAVPQKSRVVLDQVLTLEDPVEYTLSEPNVLLLDRAEYAFDGGEFNKTEEILRIGNLFAEHLGYPKNLRMIQPYKTEDTGPTGHYLTLRFKFMSHIEVDGAKLALEHPESSTIIFNGEQVPSLPDGWFTDKSIKTVPVPRIRKGMNEILVKIPFGPKTSVEWCYLLGNFGVRVKGAYAELEEPSDKLVFGDWVPQGLPFYAGNVTYKCPFETERDLDEAVLEVPHFSSPVLKVAVDGKEAGLIAFSPHRISLGPLAKGKHTLEITVYGNRYNAFGTLHNADPEFKWYGPHSYRTQGSQWTDSYLLRSMGVLTKPVIYNKTNSLD